MVYGCALSWYHKWHLLINLYRFTAFGCLARKIFRKKITCLERGFAMRNFTFWEKFSRRKKTTLKPYKLLTRDNCFNRFLTSVENSKKEEYNLRPMLEIRTKVTKGSENLSSELVSIISREEYTTGEDDLQNPTDEFLRHLALDPSVAGVAFSAGNDKERHVHIIRQNTGRGSQQVITMEAVDEALVGVSSALGVSITAFEVVANGLPFDDVVSGLIEQCRLQNLALQNIVRFD